VDRAKARGDLSSILDGFHLNAMESSLEQSTLSSQRSAVKSWTRFMDCMGLGDPLMIGLQLQVVESIVMRYLSFEIGLRGMNPRSINKTYLGGIASHFVRIDARNLFQDAVASKTVKYVKRGYEKIHALMHPAGGSKKIAFTLELTHHVNDALDKCRSHMGKVFKRKAILLAITLGIYFLLRKSEYLPVSAKNKGRKWKFVKFFDSNGVQIPWNLIGKTRAYEVLLNVDKSKTDQYGHGRLVRHKSMEDGSECVVKKLVDWVVECRDNYGATLDDYVFQIGDRILVSASEMTAAMKRTVEFLGWDSSKVTAHSLRYGGATMLAAAGLPQYVIAYFGGWTADSKALRRYMQLGAGAVARASRIMSRGFSKSLAESRARAAAGS
jgi:hypothetical protein